MPFTTHHETETILSHDGGGTAAARARTNGGLIGRMIKDRYLIESELGKGGFGAVYLARDQKLLSKKVVIKLLHEESLKNEWAVRKFRHEMEALTRIDHPGVIGVLDTGALADGVPFIVMQYIEGDSLRSVMMTPEGMDIERAATIIRQIGHALTAAHEQGIIHRDLKPENIMLRRLSGGDEQVKIIDFGIAKVKDSRVAPSTVIVATAGTYAYMAPEQLNGRAVSGVTDTYSLGAIAYEMLTGRRPFNPETHFQLVEMQRAGVKIKPSDLRPGLPKTVDKVILKALAYNPGARYTSAHAFSDALVDALAESELYQMNRADSRAETVAMPTVLAARASKRNTVLLLLAGVVLLTAISGLFVWPRLKAGTIDVKPGGDSNTGTTVAGTVSPDRTLDYSLTVQKFYNRRPLDKPFASTGREIFGNGWKFSVNTTSPQSGYLYLINEGPTPEGKITYNLLYPTPKSKGGSARLEAGERPLTGNYTLDESQGTEKFWIVWSANEAPELEAVKSVVNSKERSTILDPQSEDKIRAFLEGHLPSKPNVETDEETKVNHARVTGEILVSLLRLEHH